MPNNFASYYDAIINWEKRLAREMPLLEELARQTGVRILVPACGSGGHVVALALRGFDVLGFDADTEWWSSPAGGLRAAAGPIDAASGKAEAKLLKMEGAGQLREQFAAAFCLGNALPGLSADGQLLAALRGVASALRPGGIFLTQNLNYDLRWQQQVSQFPLLPVRLPRKNFFWSRSRIITRTTSTSTPCFCLAKSPTANGRQTLERPGKSPSSKNS